MSITINTRSHNGRAWVARITGRHPKYGLAREFVHKRDVTERKSNVYRDLEFTLEAEEGTLYEYRDLGGSSRGGDSGFWQVRDGALVDVSREEVLAALPK